jgi:hypothetical protein
MTKKDNILNDSNLLITFHKLVSRDFMKKTNSFSLYVDVKSIISKQYDLIGHVDTCILGLRRYDNDYKYYRWEVNGNTK